MTRVLFLLLLTLNVATAAWWLLRPSVPSTPFTPTDPGVPALVLLSERDAVAMSQAAASAQAAAAANPGSGVCYSTGPLVDERELATTTDRLNALTARLQVRRTNVRVVRGYSVYLPAYDSRDQALTAARQLSAAGLRDYYVVTAGDQENTISLGLFRQEANARRRLQQVEALGFRASLGERADDQEQFWIDFDPLAETGEEWRQLPALARLGARPIPCF